MFQIKIIPNKACILRHGILYSKMATRASKDWHGRYFGDFSKLVFGQRDLPFKMDYNPG